MMEGEHRLDVLIICIAFNNQVFMTQVRDQRMTTAFPLLSYIQLKTQQNFTETLLFLV